MRGRNVVEVREKKYRGRMGSKANMERVNMGSERE